MRLFSKIFRGFVLHLVLIAILLLTGCSLATKHRASKPKPNIIWLMAEDICPDLSCYGVAGVQTPNLDRLAANGTLYRNAFCTSPVCSPSRSAMMTGMYQNAIGGNQHRTANKKALPEPVKPITHYLRQQGYFTALGCGYSGKTDLNYKTENLFDGKDWNQRKPGQPFFAQITFANTHRSWGRDKENPIDPEDVEIPPYYPDHPIVRRDWANGLEEIQKMDRLVGKVVDRLKTEGIFENTVIFFIGDNGRCHIRDKQFLYDGGIHVPLIVHGPGRIKKGKISKDFVSMIDISAAILSLAGCELPEHLHGRDFLNSRTKKRKVIFAARDKMDNTHDAMRAVRSKDFKYILNLLPERPWCQYNEYKERQYPVLALMNVMHMKEQLDPVQARFMQSTKPKEELYDLRKDPHETVNLAEDPKYAKKLQEMQKLLADWRQEIGDQSVTEEFRKGGWPADYPTRTLNQWERILYGWQAHLFEGSKQPNAKPLHQDSKAGQKKKKRK